MNSRGGKEWGFLFFGKEKSEDWWRGICIDVGETETEPTKQGKNSNHEMNKEGKRDFMGSFSLAIILVERDIKSRKFFREFWKAVGSMDYEWSLY